MDATRRKFKSGYYNIVLNSYKIIYWMKHGRSVDAPLRPFELYWISPDDIQRYPTEMVGNRFGPLIAGGRWDKEMCSYANRPVHTSFVDRFVNGKEWAETEEFARLIERSKTKDDIRSELAAYDRLFHNIKEEGYRSQDEILRSNQQDSVFPKYNEVQVDVTRHGEFVFFHGQHRLSIAKILGLNSIPVMIRLRHRQWQDKRDHAWNHPQTYTAEQLTHPDLELIKERVDG